MKRSRELDDFLRATTRALERGDADFGRRFNSKEDGVLAIGTSPEEWAAGYDRIVEMVARPAPSDDRLTIELEETHTFEEGDIGWIAAKARYLMVGNEIPARITAVARREEGEWKWVQSHASIGVPDADMARYAQRASQATSA